MTISAVVVNLNQSAKLKKCFESLKGFADEIILIDLGSKDLSLTLARQFNAKVIKHPFVPYVEEVRNDAVSKAKCDWILVLDPDEVVSQKLKEKLKETALSGKYEAVNIPRKNIFWGKWIAHTNWWPDKHVRFFKKGHCLWGSKIHQYPEVSGRILNLAADEETAIIHYGYDSISQFLKRQNRYSEIEAKNLFEEEKRFSWFDFVRRPAREFLVRFIRHGGFLDGFHGVALTFLMMIYQFEVMIKLWELEQNRT